MWDKFPLPRCPKNAMLNFWECENLKNEWEWALLAQLFHSEKNFSATPTTLFNKRQQGNTQRKFNYAKRKYKNIFQDFSMQKLCTEDRELPLRRSWHPLPLDNVKKLGANKTICIFKLIFASGRLDEKKSMCNPWGSRHQLTGYDWDPRTRPGVLIKLLHLCSCHILAHPAVQFTLIARKKFIKVCKARAKRNQKFHFGKQN